jgi:hypothetical protein
MKPLFSIAMVILCLIAGYFIASSLAQASISLGAAVASGYSYVPHLFTENLWLVTSAFVFAWLIHPNRKFLDLLVLPGMLIFPLLFFIVAGGGPLSLGGSLNGVMTVGIIFAWAMSIAIAVYVVEATFSRIQYHAAKRNGVATVV